MTKDQATEILVAIGKLSTQHEELKEDIHEIRDNVVPRKEYEANKTATCEKIQANRRLSWYSLTTVIGVVAAAIGKIFGVI